MARGSIEKRATAQGITYRARLDVGLGADGKRIQQSRTFPRRKDAQDWITKKLHELRTDTYVEPSDEPLAAYLTHWLETIRVKPVTQRRYDSLIRNHIAPAFGDVPLARLSGRAIQTFYNRVAEAIPASAYLAHVVLHAALEQARIEGLLARNPCDGLSPPRAPRKPQTERIRVWTAEQLATFLEATRGHRDWPLWWLAAYTGLRSAELVALRWEDVDLARRTLRVALNETRDAEGRRIHDVPKSPASRRTIGLDRDTVVMLHDHWRRQSERRAALGSRWHDAGLVFERGDGTALTSGAVQDAFSYRTRTLVDVPDLSIHGLRHSHASLLLASGRPLHYVSRRLGHASIQTTVDLYAHLVPGSEWEDADAFAALVDEGKKRAESSGS